NIDVSLRSSWNGAVIGSATIAANSLSTSEAWYSFDIGSVVLNDNTTYYIQVDSSGSGKVFLDVHNGGSYSNGDLIDKDGNSQAGKDAAFRIVDISYPPQITSNGGGATANVNAAENQVAVTTVTSTDVDGDTPVYSIIGGADAALFSIDSGSGVLTFNSAPDFESPGDVGANNIYDVQVQVSDGKGNTDTQDIAVTVTDENDLPTATNNTVATNEDTTYTFTTADFNYSDGDGDPMASAEITTLESIGALQLSGIDVTINQVISKADIDAGKLAFVPVGNDSGTSYDSFGFSVNDGTADSAPTYTMTIDVNDVNYAPTFSGTLDGTPTFIEGGVAVVLDVDVDVSDADLDALNSGNGNYDGASVTLVRNGGANAEDIFSNSGLLSALTESGALVYNGTTIGTVTTNSGGTLLLTFNTNATSALVDSTLQAIAYSNSSDDPPATAQIDWSFDDGNIVSQGSGGALQAVGSTTVTITAVNDTPTLAATAADDTLTENTDVTSGAVFPTVTIDPIETGDSISEAQVTLAGGLEDSDIINVNGTAITGLTTTSATGAALASGGTYDYDHTTGVLTINFAGSTTAAAAETILEAITFGIDASDNDPSTTARTVTLNMVTDNGGG
ncbi:MAG: hypothetical protein GY916_15195, partial [Gammaproteobacteria bacterium]|nr:hypothetical protein [Gammaproteobacteria bacterium]